MGPRNKLLCDIDGLPMLRHAVDAACASRCVQTLVVSGHDALAVEAALACCPVTLVRNCGYADGLSSSLACGLQALPEAIDGVVVLLGDMPRIRASHIDQLIAVADRNRTAIIVPERQGRRGNPVLWPRCYFPALLSLSGDQGGRALLERYAACVRRVDFEDDAIFSDIDTPEALAQQARAQST